MLGMTRVLNIKAGLKPRLFKTIINCHPEHSEGSVKRSKF